MLYRPGGRRFASYVELEQQAEQARERADVLAARLRAMGVDPDEV